MYAAAAKILDFKAEGSQKGGVLQNGAGFLPSQPDRQRGQEKLTHNRFPRGPEFLKKNPLMGRVFVQQQDLIFLFNNNIRIQNLAHHPIAGNVRERKVLLNRLRRRRFSPRLWLGAHHSRRA